MQVGAEYVLIAIDQQGFLTRAFLVGFAVWAYTLFVPSGRELSSRKHWIAYTLRPRGALVLDRGASEAIQARNRSVLSIGVLGVRGAFAAGDSVSLELSPYDLSKGRITFRHIEGRGPGPSSRR